MNTKHVIVIQQHRALAPENRRWKYPPSPATCGEHTKQDTRNVEEGASDTATLATHAERAGDRFMLLSTL